MSKRHAPRLSLSLLGSPRIELDGKPAVDTRKAIALLVYLAITRKPHSREALAALFWPEYDQGHAFAALRRTLSALNKASGGASLEIERETIGLSESAAIQVDVSDFQQRLTECRSHGHPRPEVCARCLAPLTTAAELYRGDFLAGFSLRYSAAFDDWQFFQAENLRREFLGVLARLVQLHGARGESDAAIGYARRYLSIDPLHEPAQRELMKLYALTGQRAAALRQYQECARVLKQELDVEPLAETTQLVEAIKANKLQLVQKPYPIAVSAISRPPSAIPTRSSVAFPNLRRCCTCTCTAVRAASSRLKVRRESARRALPKSSSIGCASDRARSLPRAVMRAK